MEKTKAAPQNGTTQNMQTEHSITPLRIATKLELVAIRLLENGLDGISALSSLARDHDLNPRNSVSILRNRYGVAIQSEYFDHQHSGGGIAKMKRYWLADRNQASKLAELVNMKRKKRGAEPLSREQITHYLAAMPASEQPKPAA